VQDLALGLVEPPEVHMGPLLQLVQAWLVFPPEVCWSGGYSLKVSIMSILQTCSPPSCQICSRTTLRKYFYWLFRSIQVTVILSPVPRSCKWPLGYQTWPDNQPKASRQMFLSTEVFLVLTSNQKQYIIFLWWNFVDSKAA